MLKTILAYTFSIVAAPAVAGFSGFLLTMFLPLNLIKDTPVIWFALFIKGAITTFLGVWVCAFIFTWLGKEIGFVFIALLLFAFFLNDFRRTKRVEPHSWDYNYELSLMVGDLIGIVIAGLYFVVLR